MFPSMILSNRSSSQRQLGGAVTCTVPAELYAWNILQFGKQAKWKQKSLNKHSSAEIVRYGVNFFCGAIFLWIGWKEILWMPCHPVGHLGNANFCKTNFHKWYLIFKICENLLCENSCYTVYNPKLIEWVELAREHATLYTVCIDIINSSAH